MTIEEFQKNTALVSDWHEVLKMPITKIVLGVMENYAPVNRILKSDITPTFANIRLGHQTGWAEYAKTLTEGLLISPKQIEPLEHTYEPEPDPEQPQE